MQPKFTPPQPLGPLLSLFRASPQFPFPSPSPRLREGAYELGQGGQTSRVTADGAYAIRVGHELSCKAEAGSLAGRGASRVVEAGVVRPLRVLREARAGQ